MFKQIAAFLTLVTLATAFLYDTKVLHDPRSGQFLSFTYLSFQESNDNYLEFKVEWKLDRRLQEYRAATAICTRCSNSETHNLNEYDYSFGISSFCYLPEGCDGYQLHTELRLGGILAKPDPIWNGDFSRDISDTNKGNLNLTFGENFDISFSFDKELAYKSNIPLPGEPVSDFFCFINFDGDLNQTGVTATIDLLNNGWTSVCST